MSEVRIPLVDVRAQHRTVGDQIAGRWAALLDDCDFILGREVEIFEASFARWSNVRHCVGVGNGTEALELALRAGEVGAGDEVILPVNSFIASSLAIARTGATPVFVDVEPVSHLIDPEQVQSRLGRRTRAVMPVHLYGQMAPMETLREIVGEVAIIEDAAQAHGATRHGEPVGTGSVAAGISFYPGKNLGAYGDGGAVLTDRDDVARRIRRLRNYGGERKYEHIERGVNSRLDSVQAAVLNAKLPHLEGWNAARRRAASRYDALLAPFDEVDRPVTLPGNEHVWHLYVVGVPHRDAVLEELHAAGIAAGVHYPVPSHLQPAFRDLGHRFGDFPVAERAASRILSLPLFPEITPEQQEEVCEVLLKAMR